MIRKCTVCKNDKPATNEFFHNSKDRPLGLDYRCKECSKLRKENRIWSDRLANMTDAQKEKSKEAKRKYNKTPKGMAFGTLKSYQKNDKIKGFDNDLDVKYVEVMRREPCHYCGYPSTGLDRLDNSIGHLKKNCVSACKECNIARNDLFSVEEMLILGQTIKLIKDKRNVY